MNNSFTLHARKLASGKFEGRVTLDGKHLASATVSDLTSLENRLDAKWDELMIKFGKKVS
jgi:hypothetical protein